MQTFLPYSSFFTSAFCLDSKRLGKQRVEAKQILNILTGKAKPNKNGYIAWSNHPAVKMWDGYELALAWYHNIVIQEWICRGYKNTMPFEELKGQLIFPPWIGNTKFHASHRSNLLRKNPSHYSKFGWLESPDLPYIWPIN